VLGVDWIQLAHKRQMAGSCGITNDIVLYLLRDYQLLMMDTFPLG